MDKVNHGDNRWKIIYGNYEGMGKTAIDILYGAVSQYTRYILTSIAGNSIAKEELRDTNPIFIGTGDSNPYIGDFIKAGTIELSDKKESYCIKVAKSVFNEEKQMIIIAGRDDNGAIYGAIDFYNKYLVPQLAFVKDKQDHFGSFAGGSMPEYEKRSAPDVENRGIWTWGHVIYDYESFIDNMTKLKLNMLVVWNDHVPVNAKEMVDYAHSRGVKVIWGFSWAWGVEVDISSECERDRWADIVLSTYTEKYSTLGGDGIYFQSFTETPEETLNGILIAETVTDWVNVISHKLFEKYPQLEIQFGLHATSVKNKLEFIKSIDQRINIVWEDCGAFPYNYIPKKIEGHEETKKFSSAISTLRGRDDKFGVVFKGLTCLDWTIFEHQKGPFILGKSTKDFIAARTEEKARYWHFVQAYWLRNVDCVQETVRQFVDEKDKNITIQILLEDGMFESKIWYPVALYAEILWDCKTEMKDLLCNAALMPDVAFA